MCDETPQVWLLLGHKAGDNNQVLALAESLNLPFAERHLRYRWTELCSNLLLGPNVLGIDAASRRRLTPPWPRLVITAGRRNEPVARWIRERSPHPVRLVHIGRPWADPGHFDLIVTTPQYQLPDRANVLRVELPLHRISRERLTENAARWAPRLESLPSPRIAVLVGGESGPFNLDAGKARRLGQAASALAADLGGSLLVTTSARTSREATDALAGALCVPHLLFRWERGGADNPYLAFLELADSFIVTGESMSMLAEASCMRRPLYIFDMRDPGAGTGNSAMNAWDARLRRLAAALRYRSMTHRLAQRFAPRRMRRDVGRLHAALMASGRAVYLGQRLPEQSPPPLPDTGEATVRVRALLEETGDRRQA